MFISSAIIARLDDQVWEMILDGLRPVESDALDYQAGDEDLEYMIERGED
ncbi:hypothetical protein KKA00_06790 [bacterium]|nr:hypothetical protein [bacterium]MBU1651909.1 hypothetical protein [bacterium]